MYTRLDAVMPISAAETGIRGTLVLSVAHRMPRMSNSVLTGIAGSQLASCRWQKENVMFQSPITNSHPGRIATLIAITLFAAACGQVESDSPTGPTPVPTRSAPAPTQTPAPAPAPAPVPAPPSSAIGRLQVTINPNPVPFSGQPITDVASCRDRANTWFYEQVLRETGGVAVTVVERVDSFDGAVTSRSNPNIQIAANGSTTIRTRWCSATASAHTAQTNFSGTDASGKTWSVNGTSVRLLAK